MRKESIVEESEEWGLDNWVCQDTGNKLLRGGYFRVRCGKKRGKPIVEYQTSLRTCI